LDERDFAELISVFLKGSELDDVSSSQEKKGSDPAITKQPSNEAEIRKSIIEALAERIKESQGSQGTDEKAESAPKEAATVAIDAEKLAEETSIDEEAEKEVGTKDSAIEDLDKLSEEEELVTKEEVSTLLSKPGSSEPAALRQILSSFTDLDGVLAALVVSRDGFTVDSATDVELDLDMVSAVIATGFDKLDKIGNELGQGGLRTAMLEYNQGPVVIAPLVEDIVLVIVASQWTTLGRIRWEIKKRSDEIIAYL